MSHFLSLGRIAAALILAVPCAAYGAGLGKLNVLSSLGQRLNAEIEVVALQPGERDALVARVPSAEAFRQAAIEPTHVIGTIRLAIEDRGGRTLVRLTSTEPINEPFLDLLIEIQWPSGRLVREYTFLLDPPGYGGPQPIAATPDRAPVSGAAADAPSVSSAPPAALPAAGTADTAPTGGAPVGPAATEDSPVVEAPAAEVTAAEVTAAPAATEPDAQAAVEAPGPVVEAPAAVSQPVEPPVPVVEALAPEGAGDRDRKPAASEPEAPAAPAEAVIAKSPPESKPAAIPAKPPAKQPARGAAQLKPEARDQRSFDVRKGDTLGAIAAWNLPQGASLQQMMIALYRANPDAFIRKNINLVRAGAILNIPREEAVSSIDPREARRVVETHMSAFAEYRRSLAGAVAATLPEQQESGPRKSGGKIDAAAKEAPAAAQKDQVKLSKADPQKGSAAQQRAAREDDLVARERALKEAQSRVSELERNVADLKTLLELKNQQLAELEKKAAKPAATPPVPAVPATTKGADAAKAVEPPKPPEPAKLPAQPVPPVAVGKGAEPVKPAPPVPAAPEKSAAAPKAAPEGTQAKPPAPPGPDTVAKGPDSAPAKPPAAPEKAAGPDASTKAKPPAPAAPAPGFFDDLLEDPIALAGGGAAVLVLLVGYGAYAWRRRKSEAAGSGGSVGASSVFNPQAQSAGGTPSVILPSVGQASVGGGGGDEVDPIAEADVYMAYGRDTQAEEILKEALARDPNRANVHEKLLEIYANRRDTTAFAQGVERLRSITGGAGPEWDKAMALGRSIDPSSTQYGGGGGGGGHGGADIDLGTAGGGLDLDLDGGGAGGGMPDFNLGGPERDAGNVSSMDFDLGMGTAAPAASVPRGEQTDFTPAGTLIIDSMDAKAASSGLDFDLGGGAEEPKAADSGMSFDIGGGGGDLAAAEPHRDSGSASGGGGMDFDLDLGGGGQGSADTGGGAGELAPMDLSGLSLDLGAPGGDSGAGGMDPKWQEVATKLDLAKAYQDMGDKEGARELLNEVLRDGDTAQQDQANERLASLA